MHGAHIVGADRDLGDAAAKALGVDRARDFRETVDELFETLLLHRRSLIRARDLMSPTSRSSTRRCCGERFARSLLAKMKTA